MGILDKQLVFQNLINILGWHTKRHIVVIESDDWGSIRMPSKEVYNRLFDAGIRVDKCYFCSNDSIANEDDLTLLFDVLNKHKGINGCPAVITANAVVANPHFEKIKESGFTQYFYKNITDEIPTIKGCKHVLDLWREGGENGCFRIQSHGREHLNVARWMYYLRENYPETRLAFDYGVYGLSTTITSEKRRSFLPAFDFENSQEEQQINAIASEGLSIFNKIFGYKSTSFIAPNYCWGKSLEKTIANNGVKYIQGQQLGRYVNSSDEKNKSRLRPTGKKNSYNQIDLSRNAFFEPSSNPAKDYLDSCLHDIEIAFRWHSPAIICSHRVNFVSAMNVDNRDRNLKLFDQLLYQIQKRWPDVEFMSSDQLGDLIIQK